MVSSNDELLASLAQGPESDFIRHFPLPLVVLDHEGKIVGYSQEWKHQFQLMTKTRDEIHGILLTEILQFVDLTTVEWNETLQKSIKAVCLMSKKLWVELREDEQHYFHCTIQPISTQKDQPINFVIVLFEQMTEQHSYHQQFNHSTELLLILNRQLIFLHINPALAQTLGFFPAVLQGTPLAALLHPEDAQRSRQILESMQDSTHSVTFSARCRCKTGQYCNLHWFVIHDQESNTYFVTLRKISNTDIHELTLQKKDKFLNALLSVQEYFLLNPDSDGIFQVIINQLLQLTDSEFGLLGVVLYDENSNPYLKVKALANHPSNKRHVSGLDESGIEAMEMHNLNTLLGYAIQHKETVISNDPTADSRGSDLIVGFPDLKTFMAQPIIHSKKVVAVIALANREEGYTEKLPHEIQPFLSLIHAMLFSATTKHKLAHMAHFDVLTGVFSRSYFEECLFRIIKEGKANNFPFILIYININRFKGINDTYGYTTGDALLEDVGRRLKSVLHQEDIVGRTGGDEFGVIIRDVEQFQDIYLLVERIKKILERPYELNNIDFTIEFSIGIARFPDAGEDIRTLQKNADYALYESKIKKSKVEFYSKEMERGYDERLLIETHVDRAIENNDFYLLYQPQVNAETLEITGIEALLRWEHDKLGLILPSKFVPMIEEAGKADVINIWVVKQFMRFIDKFADKFGKKISLSFNFSPAVYGVINHIKVLISLMSGYLQRYDIQLEMTEQNIMDKNLNMIDLMRLLQDSGLRLSIDDFGRSFSSLRRLVEMPIQTIKIDMGFITKLESDEKTQKVVHSIISLGHSLGLQVIAEGVETEGQCKILLEQGCKTMQGHFFYAPLTSEQLLSVLDKVASMSKANRGKT